MRVAVDMISAGESFSAAGGGMTTYYQGLARHLPSAKGVEEVIAFMPAAAAHAGIESGQQLQVVRCEIGNSRIQRVGHEHFRFPATARAAGANVLLSTHNVKPLRWKGPSVVVLQSMQYFFLPDRIGRVRRVYLRASVPRSLRSAERVIAVSEAARRDAIELFDLAPERIVAVHHGCSPWATDAGARFDRDGRPPVPPPLSCERPYVAIVSSLYGLKNHSRLIEAFGEAVRAGGFPHELVVAGPEMDVTHAELREVAQRAGVSERLRLLGAYPQQHLPALIANAEAIAYPSLYETFGHPVLEAFALGVPLLTSNVGGAAEVAADAAIKVTPESREAIAEGLVRLLGDADLRQRLVASGRRRLEDFSWQKCARETAETLLEARKVHHSG